LKIKNSNLVYIKENFILIFNNNTMPRFIIESDVIRVAYGFDEVSEIFLSVYDKRLEWQENASEEVNKIAESLGSEDGSGGYFDLHTGLIGRL
jgi:hypothetical protein